jgi:hypothetical protein
MSHVTKALPWCTVDIDTGAGRIVLQERWQYNWLVASGSMKRWTHAEKHDFHARADREIWSAWSNRAFLQVAGTSDFAKRFSGRMIPVFVDVRWVLGKPHWTVNVTKIAKGTFSRSRVSWWDRIIHIDTNDLTTRTRCIGPSKQMICGSQVPIAHEFGHTVGNTSDFARGDEYEASSEHSLDVQSILNRGSELRTRHFDALLTELNDMIEGTTFTVGRLQ